jgi:heme exporter protein C
VTKALGPASAVLLTSAFVISVAVPPDAVQGDLQRIMYVHVPMAWLAYLSFAVTLFASLAYLIKRKIFWDHVAGSSAEIGVLFTGLALATGVVWGRPVWGVWWTWDARLVLTAVMFFVYLGYLALRRAVAEPEARARRAAVFGIAAVAQVPLVHFSVIWWRGLHQPPTVLRPGEPQIDSPLLAALLVALFAFTVLYWALLRTRIHLSALEDEVLARPTETLPLAGAGVAEPTLGGHE